MMIISFLFIPNFLCSLWVAFSIISIEIGVIGYMALWHVNLDSISMINLIMCIGFSVDFTAHICYAYMSSTAKRPDERVRESLYALGLPIFQGAFSTILGMVALLLANNYIFLVFFKMVFLVVFCGAMHGLFLLPVLLSLFGPGSCTDWDEDDAIKMSSIEKALPHPYCIPHPQFTLNASLTPTNLKSKSYKQYDMEKDLGLGTSEENSSESGSNNSKEKQMLEDEMTERRYRERWRRSSASDYPVSSNEFHAQQVLDIYGNDAERDWYQRREARRNAQPPARRFDAPASNARRRQDLQRSSSHHNLQHPKYIQELRFP